MCLFTSLCFIQKELGIRFAVAHIDHGWREESASEAKALYELCKTHKVTFHLKKLNPAEAQGNLEAACRFERLKFFKELVALYGYQGVFLGHHKDDVSETVLKKVFEGARLDCLGLPAITKFEGVTLFRPLLGMTKEDILEFLKKNQVAFFEDKTNADLKFTRARMRHYLLPYLKKHFGKNISSPLKRLGEQSEELSAFLDDSLAPFLSKTKTSAFGSCLDLSKEMPESLFLLKHLIRRFSLSRGLILSHTALEASVTHLARGTANHQFEGGENLLAIDRKKLLLLPKKSKPLLGRLKLVPGFHTFGSWQIQVEYTKNVSFSSKGWENVFDQGFTLILPEADYHMAEVELKAPFVEGKSLDKWWTEHKVPAILRTRLPVVWQETSVVQELLTSFSKLNSKRNARNIKVRITSLATTPNALEV